MRTFAKKIIPAPIIACVRRNLGHWHWLMSGKPNPLSLSEKARTIRRYARRVGGITAMVETGTYLGDMIEAVRRTFTKIYSIEIDEALYRRAAERFKNDSRVSILLGDSTHLLPQAVALLCGPALFWLDGHYSSGVTGRGSKETPIIEELLAIAASPIPGNVILIDDARLFDGTHDYPTLAELKERVGELWPAHTFEVAGDIIRIFPRTSPR